VSLSLAGASLPEMSRLAMPFSGATAVILTAMSFEGKWWSAWKFEFENRKEG
jgi:hypothetical protein